MAREGLRRSMLNYLEGRGLTLDVRQWFDHAVPRPQVSPTWVTRLLKGRMVEDDTQAERRFVWLGGQPVLEAIGRKTRLILPGRINDHMVTLASQQAEWLSELIRQATPHNRPSSLYPLFRETKTTFPGTIREFSTFLRSTSWKTVRSAGLLLI